MIYFFKFYCHCVLSLSKNINPSLVLVKPRKTRPFITERLLMECKESNQTNKQNISLFDRLNVNKMPYITNRVNMRIKSMLSIIPSKKCCIMKFVRSMKEVISFCIQIRK